MEPSGDSCDVTSSIPEMLVSEEKGDTMDLNSTSECLTNSDKDVDLVAAAGGDGQGGDGGDGGDGDDGDVKSNGSPEEDDGLPIDRGWAWVILAGGFLNVILMVGYGRAIGVLFVEYLKVFEASATKTTLFMGVMAAMFSLGSLFSMNFLLQIIGERKIVLLGGTIAAVGMFTAVFATSITYLICTHSVLIGIGHSMIHGPALVLIGQYFKKRRALATAISMSGVSLGGSIFPPLVRYFVDEYGVRGTMLLLTGLTMNMWVGGLLYRPLESFRRTKSKRHEDIAVDFSAKDEGYDDDLGHKGELSNPLLSSDTEGDTTVLQFEKNVRKRARPMSVHSQCSHDGVVSKGQLHMYRSNPELTSMLVLNVTDEEQDRVAKTKEENAKTVCDYLKMGIAAFDFTLFKHPMFQLILVTSNFAIVFVLVPIYILPLAKEKEIPPTEASLLLSIYGCIDFFSRLAIGYIADLKRIKVQNLMAIGLVVSGTVTHFASLYNSYALMVLYSVFIGLFGGFYNCLIPVFIIEFMGQKHMAKVLGFVAVFQGLALALTHPIMGAIRDLTGSYNICFNYIGGCNYIAAICLLCEPLAKRRARKLKLITDEEARATSTQ